VTVDDELAADADQPAPADEPTEHSKESVSAVRSGAHLDRLAELEEERRFLLGSLTDLEREYDAGDVDDADYKTLKDGYTVRAAGVLRLIEQGQARLPTRTPRRWGRIIAVSAVVVAASVGIGFALAGAWGERYAGQEITGFTPGDDARLLLTSARNSMSSGDFELANSLFARVVEMERDRGRENAEAVAYFGWTLALMTRNDVSQPNTAARLDAARLALGQAIELEPDFADPQCFLAIIEFQFREDAEAALPYIERCEAGNPPGDIAGLVSTFAEEIRAATS
jgi:tetratricopeptide (TPR) repeat protein